jgi:hypothetical protein
MCVAVAAASAASSSGVRRLPLVGGCRPPSRGLEAVSEVEEDVLPASSVATGWDSMMIDGRRAEYCRGSGIKDVGPRTFEVECRDCVG